MSWNTKSELNFIHHLGTGKYAVNNMRVKQTSRKEMLKRYLKAALVRDEWGDIDKDVVITTVQLAL